MCNSSRAKTAPKRNFSTRSTPWWTKTNRSSYRPIGHRAKSKIWKTGSKAACNVGLVVDLHPTDYELRLGILAFQGRSVQQSQYPRPGVLSRWRARVFGPCASATNVRVLRRCADPAVCFCLARWAAKLRWIMTQDCLADILRASERKITIEEIQRRVCRTLQHSPV